MPTASVQSFSAQVRTTPPREKTFPATADVAAALRTARSWVEEQARAFIEEHSLPHNPWEAGAIFAGEGSRGEPVAELDVYTSEGEYVFDWDDDD
jgi:hypothetical protein